MIIQTANSLLLALALLVVAACSQELRVLIRYRDDRFIDEALGLSIGAKLDANITSRRILSITVRSREILERLQENERVESAEVDQILTPFIRGSFKEANLPRLIERDENFDEGEIIPYGIPLVQADQLWEEPNLADLGVCVVDTGIELGHPDLPTRREDEMSGTNTGSGIWFQDGNGHGTHTAGTIGAIGNNGRGIVGVRKDPTLFRFHIGKGLSNEGGGFESDILQAVQGCVDNGAQVVSMSLGGPNQSRVALSFYQEVYEEGVLIVAAAGNEGNSGNAYPASYPVVMSVAAVDESEERAPFSQCNSQVEIAGPGVDVLSTAPNSGYAFASGTSMACPHVAGVAAEVWARFPGCTNSQIRNALLRSAKPIGDFGCYNGLGSGLVQARAAFELLLAEGCEAGGAPLVEPSGGCFQNPDFVLEENPYFGQCPDAVTNFPIVRVVTVAVSIILIASIGGWLFRRCKGESTEGIEGQR